MDSRKICVFRVLKHLTIQKLTTTRNLKDLFFHHSDLLHFLDENWDHVRAGQASKSLLSHDSSLGTATWGNTMAAELSTNTRQFQSGTGYLGVKGKPRRSPLLIPRPLDTPGSGRQPQHL